jgi:sugar phosphate isomerase/epimerase
MSIAPGFGVVLRDLPGAPLEAGLVSAAAATARWGASSLQLPLAALLAEGGAVLLADEIDATVSLGAVNALFPSRNPVLGDDIRDGLARTFDVVGRLGIRVAHLTVGVLEDRFGTDDGPTWAQHLDANGELLARAAELAAAAGVTLVLKTHEEMSTAEVAALVGGIDSPALRVGFSAVNVVTRLEQPGAAFERVLPYVHTLFLDDAALERTSAGLRRHMVELGTGAVDWSHLTDRADQAEQPIALVIDLHRAEFDMPLFSPGWLAHESHVTVPELAALFAAAQALPPAATSPERRFQAARAFALGVSAPGAGPV